MSIIAFPDSSRAACPPASMLSEAPSPAQASEPRRNVHHLRRRGTLAQGRALETLGHAVEYLVDSRMFRIEEHNVRDEQEAIQILMRLSRAVFAECPEVISLRERLARWVSRKFADQAGCSMPRI